jgi:endoglucanase
MKNTSLLFRLTVLLALSTGFAVQAQNSSVLDSAPGTPATMTNAGPLTPTPPPAAPAPLPDDGPSLLSNSDFSSATKNPNWPDDWGHAPGISYESENGMHYLHLVQQQPGKMLMAYREMPIPAGVKGVKITIRARTSGIVHGKQNYMDARAIFHWMDSSRKPVKGDPPVIDFGAKDSGWTDRSITAVVPDGAVKLVLMPALFMVNAGTLDFATIRVTGLDDTAVASMKDAADAKAKKDAEHAAIIAQELSKPAITPEIKVSGNRLVTADGKDVWLQGVNIVPMGWSAAGEGTVAWSTYVAIHDWHANVIRLEVMDSFWFGKGRGDMTANDPEAYRALADTAIKIAAANNAYVVLDLHRFLTPDESCVAFWKDAAARYKNNPAVLFDIFNEPHDTSWDVWQKGGPVELKQKDGTTQTIQSVGMQALVDAVRGTGAHNIIVAGGLGYAYDLTGVLNGYALDDKGGNGIMYATHFYNWHGGWAKHFMGVAAKYPIFIGETGADIKKMNFIPANQQEDPYTWAPDAIGFIQKNHLNWTAFSFHTRATPVMLLDMDNYTPTPFWGQFVKDALAGKQFDMKRER